MLLFHGSNVEVSEPRLDRQTRGLDFGAGFYLTSEEKQAVDFTRIVMRRRLSGQPTVSVYDFDMDATKDALDILYFGAADANWLEFVKDNRLQTYIGKKYDVIFGPVANDRVFPTIQAFIIGQFSIEAALVELKPKKLFNQYCFATECAIEKLDFVKSYIVEDK